jgi:hypothetical protein
LYATDDASNKWQTFDGNGWFEIGPNSVYQCRTTDNHMCNPENGECPWTYSSLRFFQPSTGYIQTVYDVITAGCPQFVQYKACAKSWVAATPINPWDDGCLFSTMPFVYFWPCSDNVPCIINAVDRYNNYWQSYDGECWVTN